MAAPFITLTLPSFGGLPERPIFVNAARIQSVSGHFTRKDDWSGEPTADAYDEIGSYVYFGTAPDGDICVTETYDQVTAAIQDALA